MKKHFNSTHGMSKSPEFNSWNHMIQRCLNPRNKSYRHYGGRGIKVCERWLKFENFYADMGSRPEPTLSLDRVDVNGNYEPSNCRWATAKEQASNTRSIKFLDVGGVLLTVAEAARRSGLSRETVKSRLVRGSEPADALSATGRRISKTHRGTAIQHDGLSLSMTEWAAHTGIPFKTLAYRLTHGWGIEKALTTPVRPIKRSTNLFTL